MASNRRILGILIIICLLAQWACITSDEENTVPGKNGVVVSVDQYASQIGIDILKKGGNAVDAAVAVGFALAVTYPAAGNIGGGGFMIIRFPDTREAVAIDFREMAPAGATPNMYLDEKGNYDRAKSYLGHLAVGVPGTVKGFEYAMQKYGNLPWKEVIAPAIDLAENGFVLNKRRAKALNGLKQIQKLSKNFEDMITKSEEFFRIFSKPDGSEFVEGDIFFQIDLAESLKLISNQGSAAFYEGKIAELIARDMEKHRGLITKDDLAKYEAFVREPVKGNYRGYEIISMPPPSSGGTILIEMLNVLEGFELGAMERYGPEALHVISETMRFAYLDRAKYMGDKQFGDIPVKRLISKEHAQSIKEKIDLDRAIPSSEIGEDILTNEKAKETTHYSIIDKDGIAVATTYTLNGGFGSFVIAEGTGIILNNEMADFNMKPGYTDDKGLIGTEPNLIAPYKRMLSSMTPTIIVKDGKTFMITGSPGGRTIINTVLNVIINVIDFKMNIQEAVNGYRINHEWMPDVLIVEKEGINEEVIDSLKSMGHEIKTIRSLGDAHSICFDLGTGKYHGAADKRSSGSAIEY
ncbi:MAG: gamma-glutamyltransferase [Candidatus Aminicenantes bacterium]|nr:MAG: gamma-glutamyltransferase [Candidatus Aminicenantes bacterium]